MAACEYYKDGRAKPVYPCRMNAFITQFNHGKKRTLEQDPEHRDHRSHRHRHHLRGDLMYGRVKEKRMHP